MRELHKQVAGICKDSNIVNLTDSISSLIIAYHRQYSHLRKFDKIPLNSAGFRDQQNAEILDEVFKLELPHLEPGTYKVPFEELPYYMGIVPINRITFEVSFKGDKAKRLGKDHRVDIVDKTIIQRIFEILKVDQNLYDLVQLQLRKTKLKAGVKLEKPKWIYYKCAAKLDALFKDNEIKHRTSLIKKFLVLIDSEIDIESSNLRKSIDKFS